MFLNRTHHAYSTGQEVLCMLPVDGTPIEVKLIQQDLGIRAQNELRQLATTAAQRAGVDLLWGNAEAMGGHKIKGRVVACRGHSTGRLKDHCERYWAEVYRL